MCGEYTDYTPSHHHPGAQFWVGSSRNLSVFLERPYTGRHEKAPVSCSCCRLAALHGAPRTLLTVIYSEQVGLMKVICYFGNNVEMQVFPLCEQTMKCVLDKWL